MIPTRRRDGNSGSFKPQEGAAMVPPFLPTTTVLTEHEQRVRQVQHGWRSEDATRIDRQPSAWITVRRRTGGALISLGERLQGTTVPAAAALDAATR
jgi:hypothetical protein